MSQETSFVALAHVDEISNFLMITLYKPAGKVIVVSPTYPTSVDLSSGAATVELDLKWSADTSTAEYIPVPPITILPPAAGSGSTQLTISVKATPQEAAGEAGGPQGEEEKQETVVVYETSNPTH